MQRIDLPDAEAANAQILDDLNNAATGAHAGVRRRRRRLRLCAAGNGSRDRDGAGRRASRCRGHARARFRSAVAAGRGHRRQLCEGEGACALLGQHPLRLRSARRHGDARRARPSLGPSSRPSSPASSPSSSSKASPAPSPSPTGDRSTPPAAPRRRSLPSCSPMPSLILRALEAHGIPLDDARRYIFFRLAADQDQFLTIAKFRGDAKALGARRAGLRACALARLRHRRDRLAHDDQARSAREHRARHHRRACRGGRRRRRRDGASLQRRARPSRRASPAASPATRRPS